MTDFTEVTFEGLRALPRWARVAFAARCGRRVQPLLRRFGEKPHWEALRAFESAIANAEESAANAQAVEGLQKCLREAQLYAPMMAVIPKVLPSGSPAIPVQPVDFVRMSVANAAVSAATSALAAEQLDDDGSAAAALATSGWAVHAADSVKVRGTEKAIRFDYSYLRDVAKAGSYTDTTPIPADTFAWEKELATYRRELPNLLPNEGKFVAIRGDLVLGSWDTYEDARQAGYERFGFDPILVKKIAEKE